MSDYQKAWQQYRNLKRQYLRVLVVGFLIFVAASVLSMVFHDERSALLVAISWILFFMYAQYRFFAFLCPRCGKPFDRRFRLLGFYSYARKCMHCGLQKFST